MPNAKELQWSRDHLTFLLVGSPGSGKTTLLYSIPGRGFAYIFDPNSLASLEGLDLEYEIFSPDLLDINIHPLSAKSRDGKNITPDRVMKPTAPTAYVKWETDFEARLRENFFDQFDWVALDSFTTFSDAVMDRVTFLNGRYGKQPEQDDYGAQMMAIQNVARTITSRTKMWIATAHEEVKQDEKTKIIRADPWLTGKLKIRLPLLFSNIYRCVSDRGQYFIQTTPDNMHKYMRSSIKGLPDEIDVTIPYDSKTRRLVNPHAYGIGKLLKDAGYLKSEVVPMKSTTNKQ